MNQKVKLQISSDLEDVTRVSSFLLEEGLVDVSKLTAFINIAKSDLMSLELNNQEALLKLKTTLQILNSSRVLMNKIDNRLADIAGVLDGLNRALTGTPEQLEEKQNEEVKDDTVTSG